MYLKVSFSEVPYILKEDVISFSKKHNLKLPLDYTSFLKKYNLYPNRGNIGDEVISGIVIDKEKIIIAFMGFYDLHLLSNFIENKGNFEEEYLNYLFFATSYPDGVFAIDLSTERFGEIIYISFVFFNDKNIYPIAKSFTEFVNKIVWIDPQQKGINNYVII